MTSLPLASVFTDEDLVDHRVSGFDLDDLHAPHDTTIVRHEPGIAVERVGVIPLASLEKLDDLRKFAGLGFSDDHG